MNIIAICSALNNSYIAIEYNNKNFSKIIKSDENYHSLYIISEIKKMISENSIDLSKMDAISVNCGPGSFTGIRVALGIAKVMAGELNKPLIPLNTAEILLKAYDSDLFLMDARRDMFYIGNEEKIELIYKNKIEDELKKRNPKKIISDKNGSQICKNAICYENNEKNLGEVMLNIAKKKYLSSTTPEEFNYLNITANYIQTPPIN